MSSQPGATVGKRDEMNYDGMTHVAQTPANAARIGSEGSRQISALLLEKIHPVATSNLTQQGWQVEAGDDALDATALIDRCQGTDVIGIRSKTSLTAEVFQSVPDLQAAGAFCVGTNQIDVAAAARSGVAVFNAPHSNARSVAEMVLAQIIALTRRLPDMARGMRDGRWNKTSTGAHEVRGRCLGIVGYGNIGTQLSVLAEALGMRVVFYDLVERPAIGGARSVNSLEELLAVADVVSLHVDGRPSNAGMFGPNELSNMRPGAMLINLSRGSVVELAALRDALASRHLAGAAVDVFPDEPCSNLERFQHPLASLANVILTPHIGGSTEEAQLDIGEYVSRCLMRYIHAGDTSGAVNLPQVTPPEPLAAHRVCHLHEDGPGRLADINAAFAGEGVNVEGQWLSTKDGYGYVITDVSELPARLLHRLSRLPGTRSCRVAGGTTTEMPGQLSLVPESFTA